MRASTRTLLLTITLLLAACAPNATTVEASPPTVLAAAEAPELTPAQVSYLAAVAEHQAQAARFLEAVAAVRASVPEPLKVIMWCEAGRYLDLPAYATNYAAKTHGHDGASGGAQMVGDTYLSWARELGVDVTAWPRAYLAPDWIQDAIATHGYLTRGTAPWRSSSGCWSPRI